MAYEIPQQLEYREKIMFGLTFRQLGYAFLFGMIALLCFKKANTQAGKVALAMIPSTIGLGFIFFDLGKKIKDWWKWFRFRSTYEDYKIKNYLAIEKCANNLIVMPKKKLAVVRVTPINFSIKSKGEKDAITETFRKLLNALDFPVQILMTTDVLELDDYLKSLRERITDNFKSLFSSYKNFLHSTIESKSIMNRNFYIVIPEEKHIGIDIQLNVVEERLRNLNLEYKRLDNKELKNLVHKFFNNKLPEKIINNRDYFEVDDTFNRVIYVDGYPREVEAGFLDKIVSSIGNFDLSIHITPYPIETMMVNLNRSLQKQRADLYAEENKGIINPSLEIKYKDTRNILEQLQKGQDKLFNVGLYINCRAKTKQELEILTKKVESELNSLLIIPRIANYKMSQGFKSVTPFGTDDLQLNRNITSGALSAFFPFTSPFLKVDNTGVWLGLNKNKIPIIRDIFKLPNPNGLVLAQSGGGKSYFCKLLIARYLLNGVKVMVIDPQGEYRDLVKYFKGQRINLSRTSNTIINPLDLMGHEFAEKRLSLMDLMQVMLGELTEPQKSFIDKALTEAYRRKGINEDSESWENTPPILSDVQTELEKIEKTAIRMEKTTIRSLINRLNMYTTGVFKFLNQHTNINFKNRFVCFDIGELPKQVKPTIMFLVLDYVYMKMKKDIDRKILLIDESWSLLSRTEDASYIFEIVKTCRKFNLGLLLINQEVEGLLTSEAGKSVLANSSYTLLMRQKPAVIEQVSGAFHLSKAERNHLLTAGIGEGILIMEDDHSEIKIIASDEEHKIITTNADELLDKKIPKKKKPKNKKKSGSGKKKPKSKKQKDSEKKDGKKGDKSKRQQVKQAKQRPAVNITLDQYKGCFKHKNLKLDDIKYLLSKGYKEIKLKGINDKKKERYLIKPRFNESVNHMFVIHDVAEFLEKKGIKTEKYTTKKPDIIFELNKKKIAIEVETGAVLHNRRKQIFEKIEHLNKYDAWYFLVTNKNFVPKYRKFGKTIDPRNVANQLEKILKLGI